MISWELLKPCRRFGCTFLCTVVSVVDLATSKPSVITVGSDLTLLRFLSLLEAKEGGGGGGGGGGEAGLGEGVVEEGKGLGWLSQSRYKRVKTFFFSAAAGTLGSWVNVTDLGTYLLYQDLRWLFSSVWLICFLWSYFHLYFKYEWDKENIVFHLQHRCATQSPV